MKIQNTGSSDIKERRALEIVRTALSQARKPCICFSGGKKSLVLLHMIKITTDTLPTVIYADTKNQFESIGYYIEKMRKLWKFPLIVCSLPEGNESRAFDRDACCELLIATPLEEIFRKYGFDCIFVGSVRDDDRIKKIIDSFLGNKDVISVSPTEDYQDDEIWQHIQHYKLPYCSLYDKGYSHIDCLSCSCADGSIVKNTLISDQEELIKEKLKKLGYL